VHHPRFKVDSQPLRALCFPRSRYRRNRLSLHNSKGTAPHAPTRPMRTRAANVTCLLASSMISSVLVARSWRPHSRRRRRRRLRSFRRRFSSFGRRFTRRRHRRLRARVARLPVARCSRCSRCRPVHWSWRPHSRRRRRIRRNTSVDGIRWFCGLDLGSGPQRIFETKQCENIGVKGHRTRTNTIPYGTEANAAG